MRVLILRQRGALMMSASSDLSRGLERNLIVTNAGYRADAEALSVLSVYVKKRTCCSGGAYPAPCSMAVPA